MSRIGIPQIHIIPFDLGVVFYDVLSIDNSRNLLFAEDFCQQLKKLSLEYGWKFTKLFEIKGDIKNWKRSPLSVKYFSNDFADNAICKVELKDNLFCYFLNSGICIFMFADLKCDALNKVYDEIVIHNKALIANYQKKITQATILNRTTHDDVFPEIEEEMLKLRTISWKLASDLLKRHKIKHTRAYSGNINYKNQGLSYVLTIYILKQGELSEKERNHLLCSSLFSKVLDSKKWEKIDLSIKEDEPQNSPFDINCGSENVYASWSAVAIETKTEINAIADIRNNDTLTNLIKIESYVQSRWFMADNSMDNVNKNSSATLESLQRIASLMEFCQAELDNEISANMNTLQKNLLKIVVETSEVKKLYKSVLYQIKTQLKIKEAYFADKQRKNKLYADLFLAIFSASSLYKTILDLISGTFGWINWLIFFAMIIVAVGTIIFNYKNK